jgi:hypothetical protein
VEIWEQVKGKLTLRITKEKHKEELKEKEESYHQSLLELAIEDPRDQELHRGESKNWTRCP